MKSHDLAWPCGKVHILPVGRCTCPHSPALAASSSTDALCISEVLAVSRAAASVIERRGVSMTGTNSFLSHARGHQPQTGTTSTIPLQLHRKTYGSQGGYVGGLVFSLSGLPGRRSGSSETRHASNVVPSGTVHLMSLLWPHHISRSRVDGCTRQRSTDRRVELGRVGSMPMAIS